jgi:hypothetical protein
LDCFGLFWISVLNAQSEGKVCFKEGKGWSQLLYQLSLGHGKLLSCSGLSQSPSKTPTKKKSLRFCLCSFRVTYGYLFIVLSQRLVSITRFKVGIRLALLSFSNVPFLMVLCQSSRLRKYMNLVSRHHLRSSRPVAVKSMSLSCGFSVITSQTISHSPSQCTVRNRLLLSSLYEPKTRPTPKCTAFCLIFYWIIFVAVVESSWKDGRFLKRGGV